MLVIDRLRKPSITYMPFPCINWAAAVGIPQNPGVALIFAGKYYLLAGVCRLVVCRIVVCRLVDCRPYNYLFI
jgi:hypothetical protein